MLAGSGGVPGGREAGTWIGEHAPEGAEVVTVGPSMANLVQFYGRRKAYGLSVSPNAVDRNPSYEPLRNPDLALPHQPGAVHRVGRLLQLPVLASSATGSTPTCSDTTADAVYTYESGGQPVVTVYEVRP